MDSPSLETIIVHHPIHLLLTRDRTMYQKKIWSNLECGEDDVPGGAKEVAVTVADANDGQ